MLKHSKVKIQVKHRGNDCQEKQDSLHSLNVSQSLPLRALTFELTYRWRRYLEMCLSMYVCAMLTWERISVCCDIFVDVIICYYCEEY